MKTAFNCRAPTRMFLVCSLSQQQVPTQRGGLRMTLTMTAASLAATYQPPCVEGIHCIAGRGAAPSPLHPPPACFLYAPCRSKYPARRLAYDTDMIVSSLTATYQPPSRMTYQPPCVEGIHCIAGGGAAPSPLHPPPACFLYARCHSKYPARRLAYDTDMTVASLAATYQPPTRMFLVCSLSQQVPTQRGGLRRI